MLALLSAILSAFLNGCNKTLFRSVMKVHANPWAVLILNNIGGALVVASIFGFPNLTNLDQSSLQVLLISGFLWTLASYTDIKSHEHLEVALSGLLGTLRYVLLVLASVFILGEEEKAQRFSKKVEVRNIFINPTRIRNGFFYGCKNSGFGDLDFALPNSFFSYAKNFPHLVNELEK